MQTASETCRVITPNKREKSCISLVFIWLVALYKLCYSRSHEQHMYVINIPLHYQSMRMYCYKIRHCSLLHHHRRRCRHHHCRHQHHHHHHNHHHCIMFYMDVKYGLALRDRTNSAGAKSTKKNTVTNKRTQLNENLSSGSSFACHLYVHNTNLKPWHIFSVYVDLMGLSIAQTMHCWMVQWPVND